MTTRHEFLAALHDLLKPKVYLEVGVQHGASLLLAHQSELAIGVDPHPLIPESGNQRIFRMTADDYFANRVTPALDMAFIDGSHLFEDALRDFLNVARFCGPQSIVVLDDMLPYNQDIAGRVMPPGDWTGDVWKIAEIIKSWDQNFEFQLVNTSPTGTAVVWGFNYLTRSSLTKLGANYIQILRDWLLETSVPDHILNRSTACEPGEIIDRLREDLCVSQ